MGTFEKFVWVLVARKLVKVECISATHNEHPVFHFSVEERCARTGVRRFTEKVAPRCFGCGAVHANSGKSLFGCSECEFIEECSKFRKEAEVVE